MSTPDFSINKPLIAARLLKLSAELISNIHKADAMIANWHDDVAHAKAMEECARVSHMALNEARDTRRNGTS